MDYNNIPGLEEKTCAIRSMITYAQIPEDLKDEIRAQYCLLQTSGKQSLVAVRSSDAIKESPISSFLVMTDTYHYVLGEEQFVEN